MPLKLLIERLRGGKHFLMLRASKLLQKQRGYDKTLSTHYLGSNEQLQLRYKYQHKNLLQFGIVADKDAGEEFFKGSQQKGFRLLFLSLVCPENRYRKSIGVRGLYSEHGTRLDTMAILCF